MINKLIATSTIYSEFGKAYTFNMYKDSGYYFTLDGVKLDWRFPSVSVDSATWHYNNIVNNPSEQQHIIDWVL